MDTVSISYPFAFLAGLVSFLSPCVLPLVPSYITFVSGLTLEELREGDRRGARRAAAVNSLLFALGFGVVFMTLGGAATLVGQSVNRVLPWVARGGGVVVILFGLYLLGLRLPALSREIRFNLASRPAGALGSFVVGIAFGAGWTPCIGPILGTILLYASMEATMAQGIALLGAYGLGLGLPFFLAAVGFNFFLVGFDRVKAWILPLERITGGVLVVIGLLMVTGKFAVLSATLADLGQLVNLEMK